MFFVCHTVPVPGRWVSKRDRKKKEKKIKIVSILYRYTVARLILYYSLYILYSSLDTLYSSLDTILLSLYTIELA